jgi:protein-tyrosine phosphatase
MINVLMVCLGNICRSPLAEGILKSKVDSAMVFVDSAGTGGYHIGNPPDPRSTEVAKKNRLDISHQRCRKFLESDFDNFDVIYVMDKSNYQNVVRLAHDETQVMKVKLLLQEVDLEIQEVPDPYYGGVDGFEKVYDMIEIACEEISKNLGN